MKVAIVTGASSGIGRSAALEIAQRGVGVILTYGRNKEGGLETVAAIEKAGGTAVALPLDVGDSAGFPAFRDAVTDALRDVWRRDTFDHLVNNAGIAHTAMFEDTTEDDFDRLMRVLLKGPYFLTQTLLPLLADGGSVVNTSSNVTSSGLQPGYSAYAAVKGGLDVLTRALAKEFSPRGIRVNGVAPGATRTRLGDDAFTRFPEIIPALAERTALGRVGEPDDIGAMIATLVSDESRWVTAQTIEVSGGYNL
ncbi:MULTISPECIES: SDR family NAD(P)-dependent oxidoreductase [unclassified Streptomyces]|uniref:SDR family NAD(P)-dependent oxidoreductase n=1 Tax=unclassified Streptomyces TaxID=2593676 RepID=UPI0012505C3C|nr:MULTISPECIES: SDR family oxidoreductase [unclassified Streptomyces]KAB2971182.1 SDR family oxidoreductase [Streptomyces sp. SS1-1]MDI9833041.1 SDR family oxidoreductase [Streptomyces sp. KAU_LT]